MKEAKSKQKVNHKIIYQGKNDSFFAGEEHKDLEDLNPNVDLGFHKFNLRPNPDFVADVIRDHLIEELTYDNAGINETHLMELAKQVNLGDDIAALAAR